MSEWRFAMEDPALRGLYVDEDNGLLFDRRYADDSGAIRVVGPRTLDMNIIGPERVVVPVDVAFKYFSEATQLRNQLERKASRTWSN